jgi:HEAT repeat protein
MKARTGNVKTNKLFTLVFAILLPLFFIGCMESQKKANGPGLGSLQKQAEAIILDGLSDPNPRIRGWSIDAVAESGQKELMPMVQKLFADQYAPVRFSAALAAGDTQYNLSKPALNRLLEDRNENVRIAAAYSLFKLGSDEAFGLIEDSIRSKDQTIRANAALLLGKSGDKSVLKLIQWAQKDKDSGDKVKLQALESRARLGDNEVFSRLWSIAFSSYADDRIMAVESIGFLGRHGHTKARDVLITKLDDELLEVRLSAAQQLGMLGDSTGEPEVLDVFRKKLRDGLEKRDLDLANSRTALAIGSIGTEKLTVFLPEFLDNESKIVRIAASKAVFVGLSRK